MKLGRKFRGRGRQSGVEQEFAHFRVDDIILALLIWNDKPTHTLTTDNRQEVLIITFYFCICPLKRL